MALGLEAVDWIIMPQAGALSHSHHCRMSYPGTNASRIVGVMALHVIAGVITIAVLRTYGTADR